MTSKLPVRSAEDIDATALSYAEIKALATGNPLIIEKAQLETDLNKLKLIYSSHLNQIYSLEDKILKEYPKEIKRLSEKISGLKADIETVSKYPSVKDHFPPMKIGGITYTEKAEAGKAILAACTAMESPESTPLGEYRGFKMELSFYVHTKDYCITLSGTLSHAVKLGTDIHGNITRIDNKLEGLEDSRVQCEAQLESVQLQMETAKEEVSRPFPQEQEFAEKTARLKEVDTLLEVDKKDNEILDVEPDENDVEPIARSRDYER